jgi:hypothetical protein
MTQPGAEVSDDSYGDRPFQFTLRTALVAMTVCALFLAAGAWGGVDGILVFMSVVGFCLAVERLCKRKRLEAVVALIITSLTAGLLLPAHGGGHGTRVHEMSFRVTDAETGDPVPAARVWCDSSRAVQPAGSAQTAAGGVAEIAVPLFATFSFRSGPFGRETRTGTIFIRGEVRVEAAGYEPVEASLAELLGSEEWDYYGPPLPEVRVPMKRADSVE